MSLFGKIVHAAGHVVHTIEHTAGNAVHSVEHTAGHAVQTIEHTAGHVVHAIGKDAEGGVHLLEGAAKAAVGLAEDVGKGAFGVIQGAWGLVAFRPLRGSEVRLAQKVFGSSIPLHKVWICSLSGAGGRPFTVPGFMLMTFSSKIPGLGPVLFVAGVFARVSDKYIIFAGPAAYRDGINWFRGSKKTPGQRLIHELTHVWQGHHHTFAWAYVFNSLANQCSCCVQNQSTNRAYFYTPGLKWKDYAAEKQASLVEDWFVNTRNGGKDTAREPYIIKNIRAGQPLAA
ncbi:hypothetical protein [Methylobacterium crusticola]|uniref:hypothetical protein n=1 Tax=Methylobacterium crusticola TaxID=1697972 RepID=UPI000FFBE525|nr:hypothetical protein [Methylobacterium crusticola]